MAKLSYEAPTSLEERFNKLSEEFAGIADKANRAGAEIIEKKVRSNLRSVLSAEHQNGELINALGISPPGKNKYGDRNVKIGFREPRQVQRAQSKKAKKKRTYYTSTNAMVATVLEYGRHGQPPRPFLRPAIVSEGGRAVEKMREVFEEEAEKI